MSPGDPIKLLLPPGADIRPEDRAELYRTYGLDKPLPLQFVDFTWQAVRLDFGKSYYYNRPAREIIFERIPNSLQPVLLSLVLALAIGIPLGFVAALARGKLPDHVIRVVSVVLHSVPTFFLGLIFVLVIGVQLRWLPIGSMNTVGIDCTVCLDRVVHLIGPVVLYSLTGIAFWPRLIRTEVLEILGQDFVRTARAKGLRERIVMYGHVLRNAMIPVVTSFGGILTIIFAGNVVLEVVFNWPGLGRLLFEAAVNKDFPLVEANLVMGSGLLLISYVLRDVAYVFVDPRIKVR
jgi:peptide/nickel transport system permease protein